MLQKCHSHNINLYRFYLILIYFIIIKYIYKVGKAALYKLRNIKLLNNIILIICPLCLKQNTGINSHYCSLWNDADIMKTIKLLICVDIIIFWLYFVLHLISQFILLIFFIWWILCISFVFKIKLYIWNIIES